MQHSQTGRYNRDVDEFREMGIGIFVLMQQVTDNAMDQCRDRKLGFRTQVSRQRDDAIVFAFVFVFARQTAESFTGSAASATAATLLLWLNRNLNLQSGDAV